MNRLCAYAVAILCSSLVFSGCVETVDREPSDRGSNGGFTGDRRSTSDRPSQPREVAPPEDEDRTPPEPTSSSSTTTTTDSTTTTSNTPSNPVPTTPTVGEFEYGKAVPGKPGFVTSPYAPYQGYVDVRGYPPGTPVKDPYTGKTFLVP